MTCELLILPESVLPFKLFVGMLADQPAAQLLESARRLRAFPECVFGRVFCRLHGQIRNP